jgi:hypothetical protein
VRRLLPFLPVIAVLGAVAVLRPGMIASGVGSWRAQLLGAGVALAGAVTWLVVRRWSVRVAPWVSSGVLLVLLGVVLWPSFRERTVVEAFPPVAPSVAPSLTETAPALPTALPTGVPTATSQTVAVRLATGRFHGIDHSASGGAAFYDVSGSVMVRFERIDFQGTPKPSVRLVARGARSPHGGIRLGALKGEHGSFSYRTPAGFDAAKGWTVLVWCDTFDVPIAAADLA